MGIKALSRIEIGRETTAGTAVAADVLLQAEGMVKDAQDRAFPVEGSEFIFPTAQSYIRKEGVEITIDDSPVYSETIGHILGMGIAGGVAAASDGSGNDLIYIYPFPITAANTAPDPYTIEGGDDQESGEASYCFATKIGLKWGVGEELMFSADIVGRQWTDCSFTGTNPSVTLHALPKAKLYVNNSGATGIFTQKTQTFMGFALEIPTAWVPVYSGDGELFYTFPKFVGHKDKNAITGVITYEHDATGEAELNFARAGTIRLVKVVFEGDAVTTAGTLYSKHSVIFDAAIQYTDVPEPKDQDGNNTVALPFRVVYSVADATAIATAPSGTGAGGLVVVNELSALA
jgi:hypothetical protein